MNIDSATKQAIFAMKARGESISAISRILDISRTTIYSHLGHTFTASLDKARTIYIASLKKQIAKIDRALEE